MTDDQRSVSNGVEFDISNRLFFFEKKKENKKQQQKCMQCTARGNSEMFPGLKEM